MKSDILMTLVLLVVDISQGLQSIDITHLVDNQGKCGRGKCQRMNYSMSSEAINNIGPDCNSSAIPSGEKYPTELGPVQIQRVSIDNHIKERSKFTLSIDFTPTKTVSQGTFDCAMSTGKFESDKSWNAGKNLVKRHRIIKGVKDNKAVATLIVEGKVPTGLGPKSKVKNQLMALLIFTNGQNRD